MAESWINHFIRGYLEEHRKKPDNLEEVKFDDDLAIIAGDMCDLGEINRRRGA